MCFFDRATLHETIFNYGTHEAKHNFTPELHACCSKNTQRISNSLRHTPPTTSLQLCKSCSFVSENTLHAQKFRKMPKKHNITSDRNYSNAIGSSKRANKKTEHSILPRFKSGEHFLSLLDTKSRARRLTGPSIFIAITKTAADYYLSCSSSEPKKP